MVMWRPAAPSFSKGENDLSNLISLENGTIYISATETALHCYLFQAMEEFNSLYPNVRFKILNNSTTESVNAVKEERWISLLYRLTFRWQSRFG